MNLPVSFFKIIMSLRNFTDIRNLKLRRGCAMRVPFLSKRENQFPTYHRMWPAYFKTTYLPFRWKITGQASRRPASEGAQPVGTRNGPQKRSLTQVCIFSSHFIPAIQDQNSYQTFNLHPLARATSIIDAFFTLLWPNGLNIPILLLFILSYSACNCRQFIVSART